MLIFKGEYLIFLNVFCWSEHTPFIKIYGCTWKTNSKMLLYFCAWADCWQLISLIMQRWNYSKNYWQAGRFGFPTSKVVNCFLYVLWQMAYLAVWPRREAWNKQRSWQDCWYWWKLIVKSKVLLKTDFFQYNQMNILWVINVPWADSWNYYQV